VRHHRLADTIFKSTTLALWMRRSSEGSLHVLSSAVGGGAVWRGGGGGRLRRRDKVGGTMSLEVQFRL
jgi:hypothetical protein